MSDPADPNTWPWVSASRLRYGSLIFLEGKVLHVIEKGKYHLRLRPPDGEAFNLNIGPNIKYQRKPKKQ